MRKAHFLVVEQDTQIAQAIERALTAQGHTVWCVTGNRDAVAYLANEHSSDNPFDIVITAYQADDEASGDLIRHVQEVYPYTAIIVMTSDDDRSRLVDVFRFRCDNYIEKPLDMQQFTDMVNDTLVKYQNDQVRRRIIEQIQNQTATSLNTEQYFNAFLKALFAEVGIESGSLFLLNDSGDKLILRGVKSGKTGPYIGLTKKVGEGVAGFVAQEQKPMLVVSRNDYRLPLKTGSRLYETESYICLPIVLGDELVGVLNFTQKRNHEPFTEDDLHFLLPLVEHFGITLKQQHHQLKLQEQTEELSIKIEHTWNKLQSKEEELLSMRKFNMDVIDSITLPIVVLDEAYRIKTANRMFCNEFADREQVKGLSFLELIPDEQEQALWEQLITDAFSHEEWFKDNVIHHVSEDNNRVLNLRSTLTHLPESPENRYLLLIVEDVSEQVIMKEKVEKTERLSEIGQLAAGVAHEINNPLDGVLRFTNLSLEHIDNPELVKQCLEETRSGLKRMSRIVKSLLQYSRNVSKKARITNINQLVDEILVLMTHLQLKKNIHVKSRLNPSVPELKTFSNLDQVFTNIIKNAYEAMDDDGVLEINTDWSDEAVTIRFRDTGPGISDKILKNLGKPFYTTKENGTGLGLSICKEILEEYGGELVVEETTSSGTTMKIVLPRDNTLSTA